MNDRPRLTALVTTIIVVVLMLAACSGGGGGDNVPVPRRKAFPRIEVYPAKYRTADSLLPLNIEINTGAELHNLVTHGDNFSLDVVYPRYRAVVHVWAINLCKDDTAKIADIKRSRLERVALNLGVADAVTTPIVNDFGLHALIIDASTPIPTPIQLIAGDDRRVLVTATAFVDFKPSPVAADSLAPVFDALRADISHLIAALDYNHK